jgi:hypothetical protein
MNTFYLSNPHIITEIYRIREIMLLPKTIVKESVGSSIYDNILTILKNALNESDFRIKNIGGKEFKRIDFESLAYVLEDFSGRIELAGNVEKELLGKLINSNDELSLKFYKEFLKSMRNNNKISEREFLESLKKKVESAPGVNLKTVLNETIQESPQKIIIVEAIYSRVNTQLEIFTNNPKKFRNTLSDNVEPIRLTSTQIKKLRTVIDKKTPRIFLQDFFKLFTNSFDEVKLKISQLNAGFYIDVAEALTIKPSDAYNPTEQIQKITESYAVAITRLLGQLEIKQNGAAAQVLSDAGLDSEITDLIMNGNIRFFAIFKETWEASAADMDKMMIDVLTTFSKELNETLKNILTGNERGKALRSLLDPRSSVGQFFWTTQFAGLNKQYLTLMRTSAGESYKQMGKASLVFLAQSFVGYIVGWFIQNIVLFLWEIIKGLWEYCYNGVLDHIGDTLNIDNDKIDNLKVNYTTVFVDWKPWVYGRLDDLSDFLSNTHESNPDDFIGIMVDILEKFTSGLGTFQDSIGWAITDAILERASRGSLDISQFDGIIMTIVNSFQNMIAPADVVAYDDDIDSFKSFLNDNLDNDKYNFIDVKKDDEGVYKVPGRGNNNTDKFYYYKDGTFEPK